MNETNISQVLNTVADAVKANTDSQLFLIAQALLKVAALPDYTISDTVIIASTEPVSDTTDMGDLSSEIMLTCDSGGSRPLYFVPINTGSVKVTDEQWNVAGAEYSVEVGKAYKYIVGSGLIEV